MPDKTVLSVTVTVVRVVIVGSVDEDKRLDLHLNTNTVLLVSLEWFADVSIVILSFTQDYWQIQRLPHLL